MRFLYLLLLSSCQWIATHPEEELEAIQVIESAAEHLYEYESKTLSPMPPFIHPNLVH